MEFESEQRQFDHNADQLSINHVIDNLLDTTSEDPIVAWLRANSIRSATTFALITLEAINTWTYPGALSVDGGTTMKRENKLLNCGQRFRILRVIWYLNHLGIKGRDPERIMPYDKMNLTEFTAFCSTIEWHQVKNVPNSHGSPYDIADLHSFRAGIKHDIDQVPPYRNEKHWQHWARILHSECESMHVGNVLNRTYTPGPGEMAMFDAHNNFVYEILERTILTPAGRTIVRNHAGKRNAQSAYKELCAQHNLRVAALSVDKDIVFRYVSTARLEQWHGSSYDFMQHWFEQWKLTNALTATDKNHLSNDEGNEQINFVLLYNTISIFPELATVPTVGKVEKFASDGTPYTVLMDLTFAEYHADVASACRKLDRDYRPLDANLHHYAYDFFDQSTDVHTVLSHMQLVHNNPQQRRPADELGRAEACHRLRMEIASGLSEGVDDSEIPHGHDYSTDIELVRTDLYRNMENHGSFIDRHGSRGVAGDDVRIISRSKQSLDITKVMGRYIPGLEVCTVGGVVTTATGGQIILIMPQYAYAGSGKTVHSWRQIEHGLNDVYCEQVVHDWRRRYQSPADGTDIIKVGSHKIVLDVVDGQPHLQMRPYTDKEWKAPYDATLIVPQGCQHPIELRHATLTDKSTWHTTDMLNMILRYTENRDQHDDKNGLIKEPHDGNAGIDKDTTVMDFEEERQDQEVQDCIADPSGETQMDFAISEDDIECSNRKRTSEQLNASHSRPTGIKMGSATFPNDIMNTTPHGMDAKHLTTLTDKRGVTSLESE